MVVNDRLGSGEFCITAGHFHLVTFRGTSSIYVCSEPHSLLGEILCVELQRREDMKLTG